MVTSTGHVWPWVTKDACAHSRIVRHDAFWTNAFDSVVLLSEDQEQFSPPVKIGTKGMGGGRRVTQGVCARGIWLGSVIYV